MNKADIGLIGLAVMGENLVLNMERHGFRVAVFNRTVEKVDKFLAGRGKGKNIIGTHSIPEFIASLKTPRKIMLMVKAGQPVDDFIELLIPHLEKGDIIIDGGNSHFPDTIRRKISGGEGFSVYWYRSFRRRRRRAKWSVNYAGWFTGGLAARQADFSSDCG